MRVKKTQLCICAYAHIYKQKCINIMYIIGAYDDDDANWYARVLNGKRIISRNYIYCN
jgi:hypothetical protein